MLVVVAVAVVERIDGKFVCLILFLRKRRDGSLSYPASLWGNKSELSKAS